MKSEKLYHYTSVNTAYAMLEAESWEIMEMKEGAEQLLYGEPLSSFFSEKEIRTIQSFSKKSEDKLQKISNRLSVIKDLIRAAMKIRNKED